MLCDSCGKHEAVIHRVMIINGKKLERHLCPNCAVKGGSISFKLPSLTDLTSVSFKAEEPDRACICGATLEDFQESGLLGCPKCYETFAEELLPVIKRSQGGRSQHLGTKPSVVSPVDSMLSSLRKELSDAIEKEEYELAAELRDKIRELSGEGK